MAKAPSRLVYKVFPSSASANLFGSLPMNTDWLIVPVVGSALIWGPAAAWLALDGHWGRAVLLAAICGGVAGIADNLVRPLLLRNRTRLNDLLLFISILGGLQVFGLLGLVVGPTIVAAALGVFRVYTEHREELEGVSV